MHVSLSGNSARMSALSCGKSGRYGSIIACQPARGAGAGGWKVGDRWHIGAAGRHDGHGQCVVWSAGHIGGWNACDVASDDRDSSRVPNTGPGSDRDGDTDSGNRNALSTNSDPLHHGHSCRDTHALSPPCLPCLRVLPVRRIPANLNGFLHVSQMY